jgi:hypothetical protein
MTVTTAGYHILMILSAVDHHFHAAEDAVIKNFLLLQFPEAVDLDEQLDIISALKTSEWEAHYGQAMHHFFNNANHKEQKVLLNFALDLVKADNRVTPEEHSYMKMFIQKYQLMQQIHQN